MIKELTIEKTRLPAGWIDATIGDVCKLMTGGTPSRSKKEYYDNGTINWLVSGDIHKRIINDCSGKITELGLNNSNAKFLPINSVMIALNGQGKTRGTVAILKIKATCNQSLISIYPKDDKVLIPELIYTNLLGRYNEIRKITEDGGNDRRGLNMPLIRKIRISFPKSIFQQKLIVATLDKAFAAIDIAKANSEQNLQNAKELFESYLQNVFENKGNDWENKTISSLVDEKVLDKPLDGNHGETHPVKSDFIDSGVPFIMSKDLVDGGVNQTTCHFISREQADSLRKGFSVDDDVLLTHKGTIGRVAILKTDLDYVMLTPQVTYYRVLNNKVLYNRYLFYYLKSPIFQIPLKEIAGVGATRAYIGITKQRELKIRYPNNLNLQMDIVERLDNLSVETKKLEAIYTQKIADLEEMKKSLLQKAFSGQLSSLN